MKSLFIFLLIITTTCSGSFMIPTRNNYKSYNLPQRTNLKGKIIKNLVEHPQFESLQTNLLQNNFINELINYKGIDSVVQYVNYYYPSISNKHLNILMKNHFRDFYNIIKLYKINDNSSKNLENNEILKKDNQNNKQSTGYFNCSKKNQEEDCIKVTEKKYTDKYSFKLKWADTWSESDVW